MTDFRKNAMSKVTRKAQVKVIAEQYFFRGFFRVLYFLLLCMRTVPVSRKGSQTNVFRQRYQHSFVRVPMIRKEQCFTECCVCFSF